MQVFEKIAQTMARRYDIDVRFAGNEASTDGKTIYLPALPETIDERIMTLTRGYCDHETGHIKHSSFTILHEILKMKNAGAIKDLTNLFEDIRIEKIMTGEYAGTKDNFTEMVNVLFQPPLLEKSILTRMAYEARRQVCGMNLKNGNFKTEIEAVFGEAIFDKISKLENSQDALNLALEVLETAAEETRKEQERAKKKAEAKGKGGEPQEQNIDIDIDEGGKEKGGETESDLFDDTDTDGEGDTEKDGEDEKDGADGKGDTDTDGEGEGGLGSPDDDTEEGSEGDEPDTDLDPGDGRGKDGEGKTDASDTDADTDSDSDLESEAQKNAIEKAHRSQGGKPLTAEELSEELDKYKDIGDLAKGELEEAHMKAMENMNSYMILDASQDKEEKVRPAEQIWGFNEIKKKLAGMNVMRAKVGTLFQTRVASRWQNDREQGKVNGRSLPRVETGYKNVFREKYVSRDTDTAITFLVDFSGSMSGGARIHQAMRAVVLFLETLNSAKIKSEVLGYTAEELYGRGELLKEMSHGEYQQYGRVEKLITYVFKEFNEPYNTTVKKRIANYRTLPMSENCDGDSVLVAYSRIIKRREKRKIIFVLTDGAVSNRGNHRKGVAFLKKVVKEINKAGVETIGVGIGEAIAVKEFYPRSMYVQTENLAETMFAQLKEILKIK